MLFYIFGKSANVTEEICQHFLNRATFDLIKISTVLSTAKFFFLNQSLFYFQAKQIATNLSFRHNNYSFISIGKYLTFYK